ncbi:tetratricopeptide repeat protein [Hyalangium gracile]|uniref:tetratricopeptide repeat protein n=1 Tax=Hyalangium gracile TaxID=394092 RepID=UPI001CCDCB33|nr:hypothetical protein [Hyalangium gracile]
MLLPLLLVLAAAPAAPAAASSELEPAYLAFAQQMEQGITDGQGQVIDSNVDMDQLFARISKGIPAPKEFADSFKEGMRRQGMQFGKQIVALRGENAAFRLLNARTEGGVPRALYRSSSDAGLNYLDFELARNAKGEVIIVDIYTFISGENFSETARRMYIAALADAQKGILDKLMGKEQEFLKELPKMQKMQQLFLEKKYPEVLDTFAKMGASMRQHKPVLLIRMSAAEKVSEAEYQKSIAEFEKAYPGDPSLDLVSIDGHLLRKDYPAVLKTIDRLNRRVKDPYLPFLSASVLLDKGDTAEAKKYFEEAIRTDVHYNDAWFALIGLSLQEKAYADTASLLTRFEKDGGAELSDLTGIKEYEGFVKSPEGKAWLKKRKQKKL